MKKIILLFAFACFLTSCNVTESIVFNENGSGEFVLTYEMGDAVSAMTEAMGGDQSDDEKKKKGEVMDTTMVFAEIMETYKDSIADLPEDKRLAMEAVKDMYMTMKMDEDAGVMDIGVGMKFNSISDLLDIQEKIRKAQSLNGQSGQVDALKGGSPLGKFMGDDDNDVMYLMTDDGFSRMTKITVPEEGQEEAMEDLFDENDEGDKKFMEYFENAYYNVKLTFPKAVKSISVEGAEFSNDRKTVTYKANWIEYIKNPLLLDANIKFVDE